jgi:hypothetical protein
MIKIHEEVEILQATSKTHYVQTFMTISNVLHNILEPVVLRKFAEYEKGKLEQMTSDEINAEFMD